MNVVENDKGPLRKAVKAGYPVSRLRLFGKQEGDDNTAKLFRALSKCTTLTHFKERSLRPCLVCAAMKTLLSSFFQCRHRAEHKGGGRAGESKHVFGGVGSFLFAASIPRRQSDSTTT